MRTLTSVFSILALTLAIGCGSDDDDGGTVDAAVAVDAMVAAPDAMVVTSADGQACAPTMAEPTGGCPATHLCVNLKCSESCPLVPGQQPNDPMQPDNMTCTAYDGPGASVCLFGVSADGNPPYDAAICGIFCEDTMGVIPGCANGACDGTCPSNLTCQVPNGAPAGIKACL